MARGMRRLGLAVGLLLGWRLVLVPASARGQSWSDSCGASPVVTGFGTFAFDSRAATTDGPAIGCGSGMVYDDVWLCWLAPIDGMAAVDVCGTGTDFDTQIAVYDGCGCPAPLSELACNDDACGVLSRVAFACEQNHAYLIRLGGFSEGTRGVGAVRLGSAGVPPTNDACSSPEPIAGLGMFAYDRTSALTEGPAQRCSNPWQPAYNDVWFCWTATETGTVRVSACDSLAEGDVVGAVYAGCGCPPAGSELGCWRGLCSRGWFLDVDVSAGASYMIRVGAAVDGRPGVGELRIAPVPTPTNDVCESAASISGFTAVRVDTRGAVTDGPVIACGAGQAYRDVWYCWTAERTGTTRMELCSVNGDSVLAVYEGCGRPGAGTELVCNDDACSTGSAVTFLAQAGRSYLVRAGGWSDQVVYDGVLDVKSGLPGVIRGPEMNPANGHEYWLLEPSSWTDAESAAQEMGGHLATVRSQEENDWLIGLLDGGDVTFTGWLGLTDAGSPGVHRWTSGEASSFRRWAPGEPDHAGGVEYWVQLDGGSGEWSDAQDVAWSAGAIVEVIPGSPCDYNGDGFVDFFDYDAFVGCFEGSGCPNGRTADYNGDGFADFFDYDDFVAAYESGC